MALSNMYYTPPSAALSFKPTLSKINASPTPRIGLATPKVTTQPTTPKLGDWATNTSQVDFTDAGGGTAKYRNIFDLGQRYTPNITSGDNANVHYDKPMLDDWSTWQPEEENLKGIVSARMEQAGGEGFDQGGGLKFDIDYSKLPNGGLTKFGLPVDQVIPIRSQKDLNDLRNRGMVVYDPNYGWITPRQNKKESLWSSIPSAAIQMAAGGFLGAGLGAGLMGLAGASGIGLSPTLASGLGNMGVSSLTSGKAPGAGSLASLAGSYFGLPSWAKGLASYGVNTAVNRGRGG